MFHIFSLVCFLVYGANSFFAYLNAVDVESLKNATTSPMKKFDSNRACNKDLSSVDSISEETHKGKYMEHIQEIYMGSTPPPSTRPSPPRAPHSPTRPSILLRYSIYFLNMFHICSLVRFLISGVKSRSGHDRS